MTIDTTDRFIPAERVKVLLGHCARYFTEGKANEREIQNCADDLVGGELADQRTTGASDSAALQASVAYYASTLRRELAEKILLELIRLSGSPHIHHHEGTRNEGCKLAWSIADAFLKAELTP